jgi:hypothetical protein
MVGRMHSLCCRSPAEEFGNSRKTVLAMLSPAKAVFKLSKLLDIFGSLWMISLNTLKHIPAVSLG